MSTKDDELRRILTGTRRVALVGASDKPHRPSFGVMRFLLQQGYEVTPVNPALAGGRIHDIEVVPDLAAAGPLDMVDVFRAPDRVMPVARQAIALGARTLWLQLGVIHEEAACLARDAGLAVVMDRCPKIEWARLGLRPRGRGGAA